MIVIDTNIIAYLYLPGEKTEQAEQALSKHPEWVAPVLWRSEFRNILSFYIQKEMLKLENAIRIINEAETYMHGGEYDISSTQVLSLASSTGCSAYDCEFVALALDLKTSLITEDKKVLRAFPATALSLDKFIDP
jgi:predicted nucleic acid-binding protein